jgi:hypothetical protein
MNLNQASKLLFWSKDTIISAITTGIELPLSKRRVYLEAVAVGSDYEIDEDKLDNFISKFENEQPGRYPPTALRRQLLVESNHRCGICRELTPIEFHHIIEFAKIGHYDPQHMLALCPNCHTSCSNGSIDIKAQYIYKKRLLSQVRLNGVAFSDSVGPTNFSWDDTRQVINALYAGVIGDQSIDGNSRFDFSLIDLQRKNELNNLSAEYFQQVVLEQHEPYFHRIDSFLKNPVNAEIAALYYQIVDELRSKIAANRGQFDCFEFFLINFADIAVHSQPSGVKLNRQALNVLLSFMYMGCDIGRKK